MIKTAVAAATIAAMAEAEKNHVSAGNPQEFCPTAIPSKRVEKRPH